jgi:hypothetical protein
VGDEGDAVSAAAGDHLGALGVLLGDVDVDAFCLFRMIHREPPVIPGGVILWRNVFAVTVTAAARDGEKRLAPEIGRDPRGELSTGHFPGIFSPEGGGRRRRRPENHEAREAFDGTIHSTRKVVALFLRTAIRVVRAGEFLDSTSPWRTYCCWSRCYGTSDSAAAWEEGWY